MTPSLRELLAEALGAHTDAEVGGEPVTDVYLPEGLAVLVLRVLRANPGVVLSELGAERQQRTFLWVRREEGGIVFSVDEREHDAPLRAHEWQQRVVGSHVERHRQTWWSSESEWECIDTDVRFSWLPSAVTEDPQ